MIDQSSLFSISFTFGVVYLTPVILLNACRLCPQDTVLL